MPHLSLDDPERWQRDCDARDMRLGGAPLLHERMGQDLGDCDRRVIAFDLHVDLG
jgi:hypothetical protein